MKELDLFSECDGHIESVLIGCETVKVSFQTWDAKKLVLIYHEVEEVKESHCVLGDISDYVEQNRQDGLMEYTFWDVNDEAVLKILAKTVHIYQVDDNMDSTSTLHYIQCDDIGGGIYETH